MLRKVHLHGHMKEFHDGPIEVVAETVAQALEIVTRQLEGFKPHPVTGRQRIAVVGHSTEESLHENLLDKVDIHVVPQFAGGKKGGLLQILVGVALVAVGFFAFGATTWLGSMMMKVGALAALGGLASMLSPQPETDSNTQNQSQYLGAPKNTTQIGTRIPILYGKRKVYGQILSFDVNSLEYEVREKED